jgi:hypothetical protein
LPFDFRCNRRSALGINDKMRVDAIMEGIEGKRLTYRRTGEAQDACKAKAKTTQKTRNSRDVEQYTFNRMHRSGGVGEAALRGTCRRHAAERVLN